MSNRYHAGFSLLELILVMVIIGMAVAVVVPRLSNSEVTILKAQVREAVAVLNYARRSAIVEGKQKVASFHEGKENTGSKTSKSEPGKWTSRGATIQWGGNYLSEDEEEESKTFEIIFYPEGGSSGGAIVLTYKYHKAKITVSPITGKIESEILDHEEDSGRI
ncbi:prepilin-type N-terminal cleavage/methylation domain-containing protein [Candidatus Marithrix sp. Canyon 246]|uniref:prepilin-type N-terminal cleavage/methylation domain-containing protein n=1 Tax=Candidatus Marithrix sp. Canyon 246 TaxID=1827136 RepID=UPI000849FFF9|nr:prepilin-type N-terminal cleavage/methylation domain-containing protein [Candidatus Marithrix sp. Canyon 246]